MPGGRPGKTTLKAVGAPGPFDDEEPNPSFGAGPIKITGHGHKEPLLGGFPRLRDVNQPARQHTGNTVGPTMGVIVKFGDCFSLRKKPILYRRAENSRILPQAALNCYGALASAPNYFLTDRTLSVWVKLITLTWSHAQQALGPFIHSPMHSVITQVTQILILRSNHKALSPRRTGKKFSMHYDDSFVCGYCLFFSFFICYEACAYGPVTVRVTRWMRQMTDRRLRLTCAICKYPIGFRHCL